MYVYIKEGLKIGDLQEGYEYIYVVVILLCIKHNTIQKIKASILWFPSWLKFENITYSAMNIYIILYYKHGM